MPARFGPAGNSEIFSAKYKSSTDAPVFLREMGLDHYEYQCGRGVKVTDKTACALREKAEQNKISLSLHAPYFISAFKRRGRKSVITVLIILCSPAMLLQG